MVELVRALIPLGLGAGADEVKGRMALLHSRIAHHGVGEEKYPPLR